MTLATVTETVKLPGQAAPRAVARLRLVAAAAVTDDAAGHASAADLTLAGVREVTVGADGVYTFTNVNPNSGTSDDVIDTPTGTVYELALVFDDGRRVVRYLDVPDTAGPHDVGDLLTPAPTDVGAAALAAHLRAYHGTSGPPTPATDVLVELLADDATGADGADVDLLADRSAAGLTTGLISYDAAGILADSAPVIDDAAPIPGRTLKFTGTDGAKLDLGAAPSQPSTLTWVLVIRSTIPTTSVETHSAPVLPLSGAVGGATFDLGGAPGVENDLKVYGATQLTDPDRLLTTRLGDGLDRTLLVVVEWAANGDGFVWLNGRAEPLDVDTWAAPPDLPTTANPCLIGAGGPDSTTWLKYLAVVGRRLTDAERIAYYRWAADAGYLTR